jgi:DNA adenine methylase
MANETLRSPLRYPGGKTRVAKRFVPHIPEHTSYREIFAGGAAVFFHKRLARHNWLNDLHPGLYAFWTTLRDDFDAFAGRCRALGSENGSPPDRTRLKQLFDSWAFDDHARELMALDGDERLLDRAVQYYFLNRTVWGGRVVYDPARTSRLYFSNPGGWANLEKKFAHLRRVSRKLRGVRITRLDYKRCLAGAKPTTFIYADPPYYRESNGHITDRLYDKSFDIADHHALADAFRRTKAKVMISYEDLPAVRALYPGWRFVELEWTYCGRYAVTKEAKAAGEKERKPTGRELLILNY